MCDCVIGLIQLLTFFFLLFFFGVAALLWKIALADSDFDNYLKTEKFTVSYAASSEYPSLAKRE